MSPVYCQHIWGDQMAGSDGAFRVCGAACKSTWRDGQQEPKVQIGQIDEGALVVEAYNPAE